MVLSVNDTCDEVTITSSILLASNNSVKLTITYNCTTDYILLYESTDIPIVVLPADLSLETFNDGVYNFKLTVLNVSNEEITESSCIFMNCHSTCFMLETYRLLGDSDLEIANAALIKVLSFEGLLLAASCSSCSCASMCDLYNSTGLNTDFHATDCGC